MEVTVTETQSSTRDDDALDLIWGAEDIAAYLNIKDRRGRPNTRKAYHLLENKQIPATKIGAIWVVSKRKLRGRALGEEAA
jgi:hypothetical protein